MKRIAQFCMCDLVRRVEVCPQDEVLRFFLHVAISDRFHERAP